MTAVCSSTALTTKAGSILAQSLVCVGITASGCTGAHNHGHAGGCDLKFQYARMRTTMIADPSVHSHG